MLEQNKLEQVLRRLPGEPIVRVEPSGRFKLVARVVTGAFADQDEADRQAAVWNHLHQNLTDDELQAVEFVFTDTPEEVPPEEQELLH